MAYGRGPIKHVKYVHRAHQWCVTWSTPSPKVPYAFDQHQQWFTTEAEARNFKNSLP